MLYRLVFALILSLCLSQSALAKNEADMDLLFSQSVMALVQKSMDSLHQVMDPLESVQAQHLKDTTGHLLSAPTTVSMIATSAKLRYLADKKDHDTEDQDGIDYMRYAGLAMTGFQSSLSQSPGVMTRDELRIRARLVAEVAAFYSERDASMCRYLPQDFTLLMNVDLPWIERVDADLVEQAIEDEASAVIRMLGGTMPIIQTDPDTQQVFSSFALEWFKGLEPTIQVGIGADQAVGNYCSLWSHLLKDLEKMAGVAPNAAYRLILPALTLPNRGWLDVGQWGVRQVSAP